MVGGTVWREVEDDARDRFGALLELRDADAREDLAGERRAAVRALVHHAVEIDDEAIGIRQLEGRIGELAVAGDDDDRVRALLDDLDASEERGRWPVGGGATTGLSGVPRMPG